MHAAPHVLTPGAWPWKQREEPCCVSGGETGLSGPAAEVCVGAALWEVQRD